MRFIRKLIAWLCIVVMVVCIVCCVISALNGAASWLTYAEGGWLATISQLHWGWWLFGAVLFGLVGYMADPETMTTFFSRVATATHELASSVGHVAGSIISGVATGLAAASSSWLPLVLVGLGAYLLIRNSGDETDQRPVDVRVSARESRAMTSEEIEQIELGE